MGILDGIVDWLATQVMNLLDLASTSVLGALGCNIDTFKRYFPAASSMYEIFIWTAIGLVLLNLVWQLYRCYGAGFDIDTENPINLVVRSVIFLLLIWYCDDIVNLALQIGGTPYTWILDSSLPGVQFGDFNSVLLIIIGVIANGSVAFQVHKTCLGSLSNEFRIHLFISCYKRNIHKRTVFRNNGAMEKLAGIKEIVKDLCLFLVILFHCLQAAALL